MTLEENMRVWYQKINREPVEGCFEKRWQSIQNFKKSCSPTDLLNLAKLFFERSVAKEFGNNFAKYFCDADPTFSLIYRKELGFWAGAVLLDLATNRPYYDSLAEFLTLVFEYRQNGVCVSNEILNAIKYKYQEDASAIRENDDDISPNIKLASIRAASTHIKQNSFDADAPNKTVSALDEIQKVIQDIYQKIDVFKTRQSVLYEDSQLLWWMMSGCSNDLELPYKQIDKVSGCLVIGKEAADLITNLPGPISICNILSCVINNCKGKSDKISLGNIVTSLDKGWTERFTEKYKSHNFCDDMPICAAIIRSNNTNTQQEWLPKFEIEVMSEKCMRDSTPLEYAMQIYYEVQAMEAYDMLAKEN